MERSLEDFFRGKSDHTITLYRRLILEFEQFGDLRVHPAKSMISIGARRNFAYVIQLGKNFIDLVLPFKQHLRIYWVEDFNKEVIGYMRKAYLAASD